jgi:hypothetical protein
MMTGTSLSVTGFVLALAGFGVAEMLAANKEGGDNSPCQEAQTPGEMLVAH